MKICFKALFRNPLLKQQVQQQIQRQRPKNLSRFGNGDTCVSGSKSKGFTLIEIIIAVAIFGVISSIVSPALMRFFDIRERIEEKYTEVTDIQKTFLFISNDLKFAINRTTKNEYGKIGKQSFVLENDGILFDLVTMVQDIRMKGINVPRKVKWLYEDRSLIRLQYPVVDAGSDTPFIKNIMLENIDSIDIEINYIKGGKDNSTMEWREKNRLPDLISIKIRMEDDVTYTRVISMSSGKLSGNYAKEEKDKSDELF